MTRTAALPGDESNFRPLALVVAITAFCNYLLREIPLCAASSASTSAWAGSRHDISDAVQSVWRCGLITLEAERLSGWGYSMISNKICNDGNTMIEGRSVLIHINLVECSPKRRLMTGNPLHYDEQLGKAYQTPPQAWLPCDHHARASGPPAARLGSLAVLQKWNGLIISAPRATAARPDGRRSRDRRRHPR